MGQGNIGETLVAGRLGCRCQREFFWYGTLRGIDTDGLQFTLSRVTIYRVVCEHLENTDRLTGAVECFHQMTTELGRNMNLRGEQWK